jgi:thioredoxin 1
MKQRFKWVLLALIAIIAAAATMSMKDGGTKVAASNPVSAQGLQTSNAKTGRVTMIDLGATECIPCKMMAPILEELKKEYAGRADIIFIDVWKNPDQARKYGIRAIPTQIFYDAEGREVHRNTGFMDKRRIVEVLTRLGVS